MANELSAADASQRTGIPVLEIGRTWMMDSGATAAELGLAPGFALWAIGRAGAMGEIGEEAAAAVIGFMAPAAVAQMWNSRPAALSPRAAAEAYAAHAAAWGRRSFGEVDDADLARCAELSLRVTDAALPSLGAMFAAWRTIPLPDDPAGRATVALQVLREMRGAAHLAAVTAVGLGPHGAIMSFADPVRGGAAGAERFGWQPPHPEPDPAARAQAEELTTQACVPAFEALSGHERAEFVELVLQIRAHTPLPPGT